MGLKRTDGFSMDWTGGVRQHQPPTHTEMNYIEKLRDPRWQKKRLEILDRDMFQCRICANGDEELHIHHISYKGEPWEQENDKLITLCKTCHGQVSKLKLNLDGLLMSSMTVSDDIELTFEKETVILHRN